METASFEDVRCVRTTDLAALCIIWGEKVWVPQSQIHEDSEVWKRGDEGTLVVTEWWAIERELV